MDIYITMGPANYAHSPYWGVGTTNCGHVIIGLEKKCEQKFLIGKMTASQLTLFQFVMETHTHVTDTDLPV